MIRMQNSILNTNHVVLALGRCILRPFGGQITFDKIPVFVSSLVVLVCLGSLSIYDKGAGVLFMILLLLRGCGGGVDGQNWIMAPRQTNPSIQTNT